MVTSALVKVRVKNQLDPDYDADESLGYRDVGLNLLVVTAETRLLGAEVHVCEVQLLLRQFAVLKVRARLAVGGIVVHF